MNIKKFLESIDITEAQKSGLLKLYHILHDKHLLILYIQELKARTNTPNDVPLNRAMGERMFKDVILITQTSSIMYHALALIANIHMVDIRNSLEDNISSNPVEVIVNLYVKEVVMFYKKVWNEEKLGAEWDGYFVDYSASAKPVKDYKS